MMKVLSFQDMKEFYAQCDQVDQQQAAALEPVPEDALAALAMTGGRLRDKTGSDDLGSEEVAGV